MFCKELFPEIACTRLEAMRFLDYARIFPWFYYYWRPTGPTGGVAKQSRIALTSVFPKHLEVRSIQSKVGRLSPEPSTVRLLINTYHEKVYACLIVERNILL